MHGSEEDLSSELQRANKTHFRKLFEFSGKPDSNQRPQRPERRALPAALLPVNKKSFQNRKLYARVTGLEPVISGVTGQRDNQLRYTRVMCLIIYVFYEIVNT